MAEGYSIVNSVGGGAGYPMMGLGTTTGWVVAPGYSNTASKSIFPVVGIGSDSASGNTVYGVLATHGKLVIVDLWVAIGGTVSATTAPVFKFWRRRDATVFAVAAGGTGDTAIFKADGTTAETMTIPKSSPTPIAGNVYVHRFTGDVAIDPGEAFLVELDVAGDAATTAHIAHTGYFAAFNPFAGTATAGAAKTSSGSIGRVYPVAS